MYLYLLVPAMSSPAMTFLVERWFIPSLLIPASAAMYYCIKLMQAYPRLAASIPVHFDFHGVPDSWMGKSIWAPVSLAIVFTMMAGIPFMMHLGAPQHKNWSGPLIYSATYGLLIGAFLELLFAAQSGTNFRLLPLLLWTIAITAGQGLVLFTSSM